MSAVQKNIISEPVYIEPIATQPMALDLSLPWTVNEDQENKFKRLIKRGLIALLLLFLIIPFLPELEKPYEEPETDLVITKLILKPIVEPILVELAPKIIKPPEDVKEIPKPKEITKPEPKAAQIKTPSKKKSGSAEKTAVKSDKVEEKFSVRSSQGLNELSSQLSASLSSLDLSKMTNKNLSDNKTGSAARSSRERLGSSQASSKSGGINVDGNLLKNSSTSLAQHTTTAVDGLVADGDGPSGSQSYSSSLQSKRSTESIRSVFERTKSNVNSLYYQARLENPNLSGTFLFKITIEPDGSVSKLTLLSSELRDKQLEGSILSRVKRMNFGSEDVATTAVEYKFAFFPS
ncbi:MAG: outer membrane biosynthesis protein TonB [Cellvibrionaceae bacterium]|jgi:outer membrane biosynthesis protein TonB